MRAWKQKYSVWIYGEQLKESFENNFWTNQNLKLKHPTVSLVSFTLIYIKHSLLSRFSPNRFASFPIFHLLLLAHLSIDHFPDSSSWLCSFLKLPRFLPCERLLQFHKKYSHNWSHLNEASLNFSDDWTLCLKVHSVDCCVSISSSNWYFWRQYLCEGFAIYFLQLIIPPNSNCDKMSPDVILESSCSKIQQPEDVSNF